MTYTIETLVTEDSRLAISLGQWVVDDVYQHDGVRCVLFPLGTGHAIVLAAFLENLRAWLPRHPRLTAANLIGVPFHVEAAS